MSSTRTSGRTHSGHKPHEVVTCLGPARANVVVMVGAATSAGAEPIGAMGMEAPIGDPHSMAGIEVERSEGWGVCAAKCVEGQLMVDGWMEV